MRAGAYRSPLAAGLGLLLSSCAADTSPEEWQRRIRAGASRNPPLLVVPGVSVGAISLGMSKAEVQRILGPPEMQRRGSWEYLTLGFALGFSGKGRVTAILGGAGCPPDSALIGAFKGRTREGLGMGSSRAEIVAALGEPQVDRLDGEAEWVTYRRLGIQFGLWRGRVSHMTIHSPARSTQQRRNPLEARS